MATASPRSQSCKDWLTAVRAESCTLAWQGIPVAATYLLGFSNSLCSTFIVGHTGTLQLAASALASMFANATGYSILYGAATAVDTLASQAVGAGNVARVGVVVQRGIAVLTMMALPISLLWWFSGEILGHLGQEQETARASAVYVRLLLPGMPACLIYEVLRKGLMACGEMRWALVCNGAALLINAGLGTFLVYRTPLGFLGAPIATAVSQWCMLLLMLAYYRYHRIINIGATRAMRCCTAVVRGHYSLLSSANADVDASPTIVARTSATSDSIGTSQPQAVGIEGMGATESRTTAAVVHDVASQSMCSAHTLLPPPALGADKGGVIAARDARRVSLDDTSLISIDSEDAITSTVKMHCDKTNARDPHSCEEKPVVDERDSSIEGEMEDVSRDSHPLLLAPVESLRALSASHRSKIVAANVENRTIVVNSSDGIIAICEHSTGENAHNAAAAVGVLSAASPVDDLIDGMWAGIDIRAALSGLPEFLSLAMPGALMLHIEWAAFEVAAIIAGACSTYGSDTLRACALRSCVSTDAHVAPVSYRVVSRPPFHSPRVGLDGTISLAAHTVLASTAGVSFSFVLGIGIPASVRVGQRLGERSPDTAKIVWAASMVCAAFFVTCNAVVVMATRYYWAHLFTDEEVVANRIAATLPLLAVYTIFDATQGVMSSVMRGLGRTSIAAATNVIAYLVVALPLAYALCITRGLGLVGIWVSFTVGVTTSTILLTGVLCSLNWRKASDVAFNRATRST